MAIAQEHPRQDSSPRRPVLHAAQVALASFAESEPERVWALSDDEVRMAAETLGHVLTAAQSALVGVVAEARLRGISTSGGWGAVDWVRSVAPLMSERTARDVDLIAAAADEPRLHGVVEAVAQGTRPADEDVRPLPVGKAAQIVRFHAGVRGLADPLILEETTATLVEGGRGADGLSERDLALAVRYAADLLRPDRLVEDEAAARRAMRSLVKSAGPLGMWRYTLLLDEEGAAVLDAAVDALAKPEPDAQTHEPDPRTPAARRADALVELVARAVSAPEGVPRQAKTSLTVTIGLEVLSARCRGAGLTAVGEMLTAGSVRRLACDAQVIPMVLGADGEILDQGQAVRLFTPAQIRHLWMRDRRCTFPGCSKPAAWADAHHLIHWADGGPTDISNAALLCRAHHTVVHQHRYAGVVVTGTAGRGPRVEWDLTAGSYGRRLKEWHRLRASDGTDPPDDPPDDPGDGGPP
jgi:hypothetical protein